MINNIFSRDKKIEIILQRQNVDDAEGYYEGQILSLVLYGQSYFGWQNDKERNSSQPNRFETIEEAENVCKNTFYASKERGVSIWDRFDERNETWKLGFRNSITSKIVWRNSNDNSQARESGNISSSNR